ncbi:beta-glucosidase (plasmid) [Azospirillum oryzae]|uniref:Beta-glucosidase n=1 Tax=Azospirillum oryzae TaxID=286727 RepID=A0A6N1APY0_9PROT|nr:GH1 family beta-glucosidase [Azospirillum oryzae]KAA0586398.1 beta-glucosidase [Azospirillum oryzae]QKS53539.1 beta-glucosidase [Azospirillum oryzae]GLR80340.1 beta-glucosidase [Azospirillum oryzae]
MDSFSQPVSQAADARPLSFPPDFRWGASTASYQIEGAVEADGRGPCVWDTFTAQGRIMDGSSAAIACDHYHRYPEDIALMKAAGFDSYRFSIAWPRILPTGTGAVETRGLDFYDRLVDGLLEAGITPMACLYHWDLPQPLEDAGGWQGREIVGPFADYARIVTARLADRVKTWMMLNEPNVVAIFGYGVGEHAPGHKLGEQGILRALHHQNLAQAAALRAIAAEHSGLTLGTVLNLQPAVPDSDRPEDVAAAARWDAVWNRVTLDGLMRGQIPALLADRMAEFVLPGDEEAIRYPIDLLGINYYSRMTMKHEEGRPFNVGWGEAQCRRWTGMAWPVQPEGLYDLLTEFRTDYGNPAVFIAENGCAYDDVVTPDGQIHDAERVLFYREHLESVAKALADGCNVKGYLCWSLLDNFEWAFGLSKRFGIVRVDYDTLERTPKDSYRFLAEVVRTGRL